MRRKDWGIGIATVILLLAVTWLLWPKPPIAFKNLQEARVSIEQRGFACSTDPVHGDIANGFAVSRKKATPEDIGRLFKAGPMGPQWNGKVWVSQYDPKAPWNVPDDADTRLWGSLLAYGDREFLAELENALQRQPAAKT